VKNNSYYAYRWQDDVRGELRDLLRGLLLLPLYLIITPFFVILAGPHNVVMMWVWVACMNLSSVMKIIITIEVQALSRLDHRSKTFKAVRCFAHWHIIIPLKQCFEKWEEDARSYFDKKKTGQESRLVCLVTI